MAFYERLSPQDCTFLYAESPTAQVHVGAICTFEQPQFGYDDLCAMIESKLDMAPRLRRRLMWVPYGAGRPVWVDDEHFDVRYHVRHTGLPQPGTRDELLTLFGRLMSVALDRKRPLWEVWLVDHPNGDRSVIQKIHHALVDGISGVDLAMVLFDVSPDAQGPETEPWKPRPAPTKSQLWRDTVVSNAAQPVELARSVRRMLDAPGEAARKAVATGRGLLRASRSLDSAPVTSLTVPIGSHRRFETVSVGLDDVKSVKNAHGSTVNDVVLSLVTGGLRHYLLERGDVVDGVQIKVMVPVSVRPDEQRGTYGNQVASMFVALPVGEPDPVARLQAVMAQMADVKESGEAQGVEALLRSFDYVPTVFLSLGSRAAASQRFLNLVVTNVPGPQFPLYCCGAEMREVYPYVPLLGTMSVGVAVMSYNGQLDFGLSGDWDATPDLGVFAEGIEKALGDLRR